MKQAIVRKPAATFRSGLRTNDLEAPDYELALQQHSAYCDALERCGLSLTKLEPDDRYPDSTFVEDTAVLVGTRAVLTRPGAASRAGEVATVAPVLARFFAESETIREPGTLDGGDVCEAGNHYFIGISERTNESGAIQLSKYLSSLGYDATLVDIRSLKGILHLKSAVSYLGDNRLALIEALAEQKEFQQYELVEVSPGEEYAANCVRVNNHILAAKGYAAFAAALAELGYQVIQLEMTEFQKMDGGLSCLSLRF